MKKALYFLLTKTNIIGHRPKGYFPPVDRLVDKPESNPQSLAVSHTIMPGGMTFEQWQKGGWSKFTHKEK